LPIQVQEASRTPNRLDQNRTTPQQIIIKTTRTENRERILKAIREKKQITYKGKPIKITADFSTEALKAKTSWSEVFWALNENNFNPRILYPTKLSFKIDGAIKIFHDKQKLKQYMTTKPPLQKVLRGFLHTEDKYKQNHERTGTINHRRRKDKEGSLDLTAHNQTLEQQKQLNGRNHHITIILTLNVNGINFPIKRHHLANWIKKEDPTICCLQETHLIDRNNTGLR
jgi:hypothetical protein